MKEQKFLAHIRFGDGCWEWQGIKDRGGYGRYSDTAPRAAHRRMWLWWYGFLPDDRWVLHRCDNPGCVRPDHLWLGDGKDNAQDRERKGRGRPHTRFLTHCPQGHEYNESNTYLWHGRRHCRACQNARKREYYHRAKSVA